MIPTPIHEEQQGWDGLAVERAEWEARTMNESPEELLERIFRRLNDPIDNIMLPWDIKRTEEITGPWPDDDLFGDAPAPHPICRSDPMLDDE